MSVQAVYNVDIWVEIKTSTGPHIFKFSKLKTIIPKANTVLRLVFEESNLQPKPTDVWIELTHGADKGSIIIRELFEFIDRNHSKKGNPVTIADVANSKYFSNDVTSLSIKSPGQA